MTNNGFTFYSKKEYFENLIKRIWQTQSGDRVLVATMSFDVEEPIIRELMDGLCAAAGRGVKVSLAVDTYILLVKRKTTAQGAARVSAKDALAALQRLQDAGGEFAITNKPDRTFNNPFSGRSHIKTAIVNNYVYVGGCNLNSIDHIDMMVGLEDEKTADWLYEQMSMVVHRESTSFVFADKDKKCEIDGKTKLLIDSGARNQSIILENALKLIDSAKEHIVITCQYFPNSVTARHLAAAYKRGVKVSIFYNHPSKHRRPHNILHHMVVFQERRRHPSTLFEDQLRRDLPFLHAKLIVTEHGAIIGSHNYVTAGVRFGTAEIALIRKDPAFAKKALAAFRTQLLGDD